MKEKMFTRVFNKVVKLNEFLDKWSSFKNTEGFEEEQKTVWNFLEKTGYQEEDRLTALLVLKTMIEISLEPEFRKFLNSLESLDQYFGYIDWYFVDNVCEVIDDNYMDVLIGQIEYFMKDSVKKWEEKNKCWSLDTEKLLGHLENILGEDLSRSERSKAQKEIEKLIGNITPRRLYMLELALNHILKMEDEIIEKHGASFDPLVLIKEIVDEISANHGALPAENYEVIEKRLGI